MSRPLPSTKWVLLAKLLSLFIAFDLILNLTLEFPSSTSLSRGFEQPLGGKTNDFKPNHRAPEDVVSEGRHGKVNATTRERPAFREKPRVTADNKVASLKRNVFFNIFLNSQTRITFFRSFKIVDEQLQQLANGTTVYFTLIGGKRYYGNTGYDICHKYPGLECILLGDHTDGGEEQTLQPLYDYCVEHPTERVTYIHDKGSFRHSSGNTINRRRATLGAVSAECMKMPLQEDYQCNICGTKYQYKPHQIYQANMWTAECSYIRLLIPPKIYKEKRQELFQILWTGKHQECLSRPPDPAMADTPWAWNLTDNMFLRNVGLGRYALERWMLNHPSMIPCDLLPNATLKSMHREDNIHLKLTKPDEWGHFVSQKVKARATWLLQQEYAAFYPNLPINEIQSSDQAKPKPRPCW